MRYCCVCLQQYGVLLYTHTYCGTCTAYRHLDIVSVHYTYTSTHNIVYKNIKSPYILTNICVFVYSRRQVQYFIVFPGCANNKHTGTCACIPAIFFPVFVWYTAVYCTVVLVVLYVHLCIEFIYWLVN